MNKTFATSTIEKSLNFPLRVYFYSCDDFVRDSGIPVEAVLGARGKL